MRAYCIAACTLPVGWVNVQGMTGDGLIEAVDISNEFQASLMLEYMESNHIDCVVVSSLTDNTVDSRATTYAKINNETGKCIFIEASSL